MAVLFFVCSGSYGGLRARRGPGFRGDAAGVVCGGAGHGDWYRSAATGGGAGAQSHVRQPAGQGERLYSFQKYQIVVISSTNLYPTILCFSGLDLSWTTVWKRRPGLLWAQAPPQAPPWGGVSGGAKLREGPDPSTQQSAGHRSDAIGRAGASHREKVPAEPLRDHHPDQTG